MRPKLLDLCASAGGASMGYFMAGFDVTGVDVLPQPNYPFSFIQGDAMSISLEGYDAVAASPPCQAYGRLRHREDASGYPKLIAPLRSRFVTEIPGIPYVIENVEDALPEMVNPTRLCGSSFALRVRRHRLFETNWDMVAPACSHEWQNIYKPYQIYVGKNRTNGLGYRNSGIQPVHGGNHNMGGNSLFFKSTAMGIDWMTEDEINESIPPAYTYHIGLQLMQALKKGS